MYNKQSSRLQPMAPKPCTSWLYPNALSLQKSWQLQEKVPQSHPQLSWKKETVQKTSTIKTTDLVEFLLAPIMHSNSIQKSKQTKRFQKKNKPFSPSCIFRCQNLTKGTSRPWSVAPSWSKWACHAWTRYPAVKRNIQSTSFQTIVQNGQRPPSLSEIPKTCIALGEKLFSTRCPSWSEKNWSLEFFWS